MLNKKKAKTIQAIQNDALENKSRILFNGLQLKIKEEKGSITLFVLVTMLFFITVLILSYAGQTNKIIAQEKQVEEIQREYNTANIDEVYHEVENKIPLTTLNSVIITFDYNAGTGGKITNRKFINTQLGTLPNSPSREGYTFEGWYTAQTNGNKIDTKTIVPTSNTTYYAHWQAIEYSITYELNNGTNHSDNPIKYTIEDTIILKDPTKIGYTFTGWSEKEGDTPEKSLTISKGSTGDKFYKANWEGNTYTIKYNGNHNTGGMTSDSIHTYDEEKPLTTNEYKREYTVTYNHNYTGSTNLSKKASYSFKNWNTKENGSGLSYNDKQSVTNLTTSANDTITLYAQWNSESVSYTPERHGYKFDGWYANSTCTEQITTAEDTSYTPTTEITLYAKWIVNSYTVTYNYSENGGTSATKANATVKYNDAIDLTPTAEKSNYTFVGWNTDKNATTELDSLKMDTSDLTLYAIYSKTITGTFKYYNNQAKTNSQTIYNNTKQAKINIPSIQSIEGYTLRGWATTETANASIDVTFETKTIDLSEDKTYYMSYTYSPKLTYDANNGSTAPPEQNGTAYMNYEGTKLGATINLSKTVPVREGYSFDGWYTKLTGGTKIETTITITENTEIYAYWKIKPKVEITDSSPATSNATVVAGNTLSLRVEATGVANLSYEWYYCKPNGGHIPSGASDGIQLGVAGNGGTKTSITCLYDQPWEEGTSGYYYCIITSKVNGLTATQQKTYFVQVNPANYAIITGGANTVVRYETNLADAYNTVIKNYTTNHLLCTIRVEKDYKDDSDVNMTSPFSISLDTNGKTITRSKPIYVARLKFNYLR